MLWEFNKYSDKIALVDEFGMLMTYGELAKEGERIAEMVESRCLTFILCKNAIGSVVGYVSFLNAGIVPALLNASLERELLDNLLLTYQPKYIWIPKEQKGDFSDMECIYTSYEYCLLKTNFQTEYPLHSELALLLTTSGSTGSPKFVRQSYQNIKANAESIVQYLCLDETERPITTLPIDRKSVV